MSEVAKKIHEQIKTLDKHAMTAWGAGSITYGEKRLSFKTSGMAKWKGFVHITLNGKDLYDVKFEKIVLSLTKKAPAPKLVNDVEVSQLVKVIDAQVG